MAQYTEVIQQLKSQANADNVAGMARYAIKGNELLGISIYTLRIMAKSIGHDHALALKLWDSGIHEARILAGLIEEPDKVTDTQLERWVSDFDSWDIVDQLSALIAQTPFVIQKIHEWAVRDEEFVKRAAFSLIAEISFYHTHMPDADYEQFFPFIVNAATDERNFVKKAVNWALRNIGKRNLALNKRALEVAHQIKQLEPKTAQWIASDAIRELSSEAIQQRLAKRK
ncbi:MAG: DNA alkylation repair protein [Dehalococcoidia bacterium]|nr:DNA alkylation repair protein [Dehalococcoidia bacterium]